VGLFLALTGSLAAVGVGASGVGDPGRSAPRAAAATSGPPAGSLVRDLAGADRVSRGQARTRIQTGQQDSPEGDGETLAGALAALNRARATGGQAWPWSEEQLAGQAKAIAARRAQELAAAAERAQARVRLARQEARPLWVAPIVGAHLSAGFGQAGSLWSARHTGQDFAAPVGTPVRAVGAGIVVEAGWDGAYGLVVRVAHPDGTQSWYAHLSEAVRSSGRVRAGQIIGRVGQTGNTTGPHLHLEIHPQGGAAVDPLAWLAAHGVRITR